MADQTSRSGLSLYANLLDPSSSTPGSISSAPVTYKQPEDVTPEHDEAAKKQQALAASLRFQPTKRPQQQNAAAVAAKAKAKAIASKFSVSQSLSETIPEIQDRAQAPARPVEIAAKTTIADWVGTAEDDEWNYGGEKRQRGGRKKRKKNKQTQEIVHDWDDVYDPSRPNNYEEYKHSEEKIREVRDWKDLLYGHRVKRRESSDYDSDRSAERPMNRQFAPPSFAPPSNLNDETPAPPPADLPNDRTGDDAYARRMQFSQPPPPPDDPTGDDAYTQGLGLGQAPPPPPPPGQIAKAPVRYSLPEAPEDIPASEAELEQRLAEPGADEPRSSRPGQAGFAERLMSKYGWSKGQGLGAEGTGITNALYAKAEKRKKKSDAEGGGFVTPASMGKIMGGMKSKPAEEEAGKFGTMSEVIRLEHMLDGMDLDEELSRGEGGIMQEIGEECGDKYGSVERVYIHRDASPLVFVQFVSQLSALRAVNALEGRVFGGNNIAAKFWPQEKFLAEDYY